MAKQAKWEQIPEATVSRARGLRRAGETWPRIGKLLGIPWQSIHRACEGPRTDDDYFQTEPLDGGRS